MTLLFYPALSGQWEDVTLKLIIDKKLKQHRKRSFQCCFKYFHFFFHSHGPFLIVLHVSTVRQIKNISKVKKVAFITTDANV